MLLAATTLETYWPFVALISSVAFIIIAIAGFRMHPFVALIGAALLAGVVSGQQTWDVVDKNGKINKVEGLAGVVELTAKGLGDTARDIAISVAFASVIGMCLMQSGAADKVVREFLAFFGEKNAGWALLWSTYILSIPLFFDTLFMLMAPLAAALARRTGKNYLLFAMCACCSGVITHSLTIPHPGPIAMVEELGIDTGLSLFAGLAAGVIPAIAGYYFSVWTNSRFNIQPAELAESEADTHPDEKLPSFLWAITPVLLPILLIGLSSFMKVISDGALKETSKMAWCEAIYNGLGPELFQSIRGTVDFVGHKNVALLIGAAIAMAVLALQKGLSFASLEKRIGPPLETAGMIILITSAGGAFGFMLRNVGVGDAVKSLAEGLDLNLIILAWMVASVIRVAQGSATVAMLTTAPMIKAMITPDMAFHPVYLFLAIGWGAMFGSWMNDSGFWVVSRVGGFTQRETLRSWTLLLCCLSLVGLITTLLGSVVLPMPLK
jgi:gluconate:H+ symporter, GntP family